MKEKPATVFVVDDDEAVRTSLRLLLKSVGLPVETYAAAQEFLDQFDPDRAGCLVLDIRMPASTTSASASSTRRPCPRWPATRCRSSRSS